MSHNGFVTVGITAGCTVVVTSIGYLWWRNSRRKSKFSHIGRNSSVYLIRHGESTVNIRAKQYRSQGDPWPGRAYHEAEFFDAPLTDDGQNGAINEVQSRLKESIRSKDGNRVRLVITSTLLRALETATFGVLPLFPPSKDTTWVALDSVRESATSEIQQIDGVDAPKEVSQEKLCNLRRPLTYARKSFPHVDFTWCEESDPLPRIETTQMVDQRISEFAKWLRAWVEQQSKNHDGIEIDVVLVSHYVFLHRLLSKLDKTTDGPIGSHGLKNCELRVVPLSLILNLA